MSSLNIGTFATFYPYVKFRKLKLPLFTYFMSWNTFIFSQPTAYRSWLNI